MFCSEALFALRGHCELRRGQGLRPFPRTPFSARGALPPLRSGQVFLDEDEHLFHNRSASVAALRKPFAFGPECRSRSLRNQCSPSPESSAFCERVIGTIRRECLDFIIPMNERHLRSTVREFVTYYNRGRPHSSLGPGIPEPIQASAPAGVHRHKLPAGYRVTSKPILGGLHHDYRLQKEAA